MTGLIGKKIGMTQLFAEDGTAIPVTAIEAGPCPIVQIRTEDRDGYRAVQLGFGRKKARRSRKPEQGHAATAGLDYVPAILYEFRLSADVELAEDPHAPARPAATEAAEASEDEAPDDGAPEEADASAEEREGEPEEDEGVEPAAEAGPEEAEASPLEAGLRVGQTLTVGDLFQPGDSVTITGRTKGRGFQGVVKRHNFRGRPKTHGHPSVRVPGSVGPGTDPSRVIKGRKMPGQMGNERRSIRNMSVVRIDAERNLLFVKGSVPGARNSWVFVRKQ